MGLLCHLRAGEPVQIVVRLLLAFPLLSWLGAGRVQACTAGPDNGKGTPARAR